MRKVVLSLIVALVAAQGAVAQVGGNLAIYEDMQGLSCDLKDLAPNLCEYHVVHTLTPGVTGVQFKIESQHLGIFLAEQWPFPIVIGDVFNGVQVSYGVCLTGPIPVVTLVYFCQGLTPPCSEMRVVGHPTAFPPGLLAVDCNQNLVDAQGYTSYINNDGSCPCVSPIPVRETTWGQVKALYQ